MTMTFALHNASRSMPFLVALLLVSCTEVTATSVNVLGVNYTEREFTYRLQDPSNPKNAAGGEMIDSFSAGGVHCCYELPKQWRPGIKVRILTTEWEVLSPPQNSQALKEIRNSVEAEVPDYVDGKPGDLWVVRSADGSFGVVSSSYQPDHVKWPGKIKGWPVPSVEYRRVLWDQQIEHQTGVVELAQRKLSELRNSPEVTAMKRWAYIKENASGYDPAKKFNNPTWRAKMENYEIIQRFSGPDDPGFVKWLTQDYEEWLARSKADLRQAQDSRP